MPSYRGNKNCASCKHWSGPRKINGDVVTTTSALVKGYCCKNKKETKGTCSVKTDKLKKDTIKS